MGMSKNIFHQTISASRLRVSKPVKGSVSFWILDLMDKIPLLFVAKRFAVGDEKLKVPGIGLIYIRVVNLINNTMAKREPDAATRMVGSANSFLCTRSPAGR